MKKSLIALLVILLLAMVPSMSAAPIEIKYFYSTGCSHCRTTSPIIEDIEEDYEDIVEVKWCNINSSEYQALWNDYKDKYSISGVPAIIVNDKHKLSGDAQITYSNVDKLLKEILADIGIQGDELYNEGVNEIENGNFDDAIALFEDAAYIYEISGDEDKYNLCMTRINDCEDYKEAKSLFSQAENAYYAEDYETAAPLYEEVVSIYTQLGNTQMASRSDVRLHSCNFFINYNLATDAFNNSEWASAKTHYESAISFTSDASIIETINSQLSLCEEQIYAEGLIASADASFSDGLYADAKQAYNEAALIVSGGENVSYCNSQVALCDSFLLAHDTLQYGVTKQENGDFAGAMTLFESAKGMFLDLEDSENVALCSDYYDKAYQDKVAEDLEIERQEREERNKRIIIVASAAALVIAIVALGYIFSRKGNTPDDESEEECENGNNCCSKDDCEEQDNYESDLDEVTESSIEEDKSETESLQEDPQEDVTEDDSPINDDSSSEEDESIKEDSSVVVDEDERSGKDNEDDGESEKIE